MDNDMLDDVVQVGHKGIYIDYQQPDGTFIQEFFPMILNVLPNWSIAAGDLDNNGLNDMLFADLEKVSFVLADHAETPFTETVMPSALISQRSTLADIDNDGWLDAFVCNDSATSIPFRNLGIGEMIPDFDLIPTSSNPGSYAAIWTDLDNDADLDLYISKCWSSALPGDVIRDNLLYQNNGDGTFSEVGETAGLADNAQSWCAVAEDFNNDGYIDLFVINHDFENGLYRNEGDGTFTNVIATSGIELSGLSAEEALSGDFNNDGFIDIFSDLENEIYLGNGDFTFTGYETSFKPGALADLNNDGFLDITRRGKVWLNDANEENHWIKVNLLGTESNRSGIGSRIEIYGDWGIQVREQRSGESYSPMNSLNIYFGTGSSVNVDSLKVKWPSGIVTVLKNLEVDSTYTIPEVSCFQANYTTESEQHELCAGDTLLAGAPSGYSTYLWSNGATTQNIEISHPGNYYVISLDQDGCAGYMKFIRVERIQDILPNISADPARRICQGDSITLLSSPGNNHIWSNGMTNDHIVISEPGFYTVAVDAQCTDEQLESIPFEVAFLPSPQPETTDVTTAQGDSVLLTANCVECYWYDQPTGGNFLHTGPEFQTSMLNSDTTFYVENHSFYPGENHVGGKSSDEVPDGEALQTGFMHFEAWEPFTLLSVKVHVPQDSFQAIRFIQLFSPDTLLAVQQFQLTSGWNELELNFEVPVGTFSLHCPQCLFSRDTSDLTYPYPLGDAGQINESSFGQDHYFFFYDWQIQSGDMECISERTPVNILVTNTEDPIQDNLIEIFPNPSSGSVRIIVNEPINQPGSMQLFDSGGAQILQKEIHLDNEHILEAGE
ncbi:MAG: CRTAC1 family protein, partial [Bacteroidetes bacterium]